MTSFNLGEQVKPIIEAVASARTSGALAVFFWFAWSAERWVVDEEIALLSAAATIALVLAIAFTAAFVFLAAANLASLSWKWWSQWQKLNIAIKALDALSPNEARVMLECVIENKLSIVRRYSDPTTAALVQKGIMGRGRGNIMENTCSIQPHVWQKIHKRRQHYEAIWREAAERA